MWHQEVHQGPKLHDVILKRGSCQQKSSFRVESQKGLPSLALEILDVLGLVQDHIIPLFPSEGKVILDNKLVRCDADVERVFLTPPVSLNFSFFLRTEVG